MSPVQTLTSCIFEIYCTILSYTQPEFDSQAKQGIVLYSTASRSALLLNQPSIQWVTGVLSPGLKLTDNLHLVPRSRMVELYLHSPYIFMA
jgi:hypothetical protein